jgi:hypothetical protein
MTWLMSSMSRPRAAMSVATEHHAPARLEGLERLLALALAAVAVDDATLKPRLWSCSPSRSRGASCG